MGDKAPSFVNKGLEDLFDRLGIVSKEFFTKKGELHSYLAFNKPYLNLEDLIHLQKSLGSEEIRIYTQAFSRFETIEHTGIIFCKNITKAS
ncbi:MAG: hypothetical protein QXE82_00230 [Candidatus Nitrosotenuis sp.]